jgi:exonuclease III
VKYDIETSSKNQDHPGNVNPPNKNDKVVLTIFHQNIRGLHNKTDKLLNCWSTELPHILCFTEHHLHDYQINSTCINHYNLGSIYCRKSRKYGGVSIFVQENLLFSTVELAEFCNDQDFEVCAVKQHTPTSKPCVIYVYRLPTGNFSY